MDLNTGEPPHVLTIRLHEAVAAESVAGRVSPVSTEATKNPLSVHLFTHNMLRDFVAIDFETANKEPASVCSVGVVMVRNGQVADAFYSLIQPEPNYYSYWCQQVHGLSRQDTDDAPVFQKVWEQLEDCIADVFFHEQLALDNRRDLIASVPFVAHNARFDEGCLKAAFKVYRMDYPDYRFYDTLTAARRQFGHTLPNHQLQTVAAACGYDLQNHHHALADAEACAAIALNIL